MKSYLLTLIISLISFYQGTKSNQISINNQTYLLYPQVLETKPSIPSPLVTENKTEIVICFTPDNKYYLVPVTVENGDTLNYKTKQWWGKGRQIDVDTLDFPVLAKSGLHSEKLLEQTTTITGKPIEEITKHGRPKAYSEAGFLSYDEDIISVLQGDNKIVTQLGLSHPQMAHPLFHIFNIILSVKKDSRRSDISGVLYNQNRIYLNFWGAKGWQESIFNDEILGYWEIEIWRELTESEKAFLYKEYAYLSEEELALLINRLSFIHISEMVPFYIMRYGFYEGHTDYRADPIAISFIFGLKTIPEIENSFENNIYKSLMDHFTI
jgi:hypothetical protein